MKKWFVLAYIFCVMQNIQGECYVLEEGESNFSTIDSKEYYLPENSEYLTFDAKCVPIKVIIEYWGGDLKVAQYVNGSWSDAVFSETPPKNSYQSYGPIKLDRNATKIKFYTTTGATGKKYFTNIKVTRTKFITSSASQLSYGTLKVEQELEKETTITYSNVGATSVQLQNNASGYFSITSGSALSATCSATQTVKVKYNPQTAGTHTATLLVTDGTSSVSVPLSGTCIKYTQTINWHIADVVSSKTEHTDMAEASSTLSLTYTSNDTNVIKIDNGVLKAVAAGEAIITATQSGNYYWDAVTSTKTITVVDRDVQTITWNQDLYNLSDATESLTLTASASSNLSVRYESTNNSVVSVSGNVLIVVGIGTASVIAYQDGNSQYAPVNMTKIVRVRHISDACDEFALYNEETLQLMDGWSQSYSKTITLNAPADKLTYTIKRDGWATGYVYVYEIDANGNETKKCVDYVGNSSPLDANITFENITLKLTTKKLRFEATGTLYKNLTAVYVTQASYLKSDKDAVSIDGVVAGEALSTTLSFDYSNLQDEVALSNKNSKFALSSQRFGNGCADFGTATIQLSYLSDTAAVDRDTIIVMCAGVTKMRIPVDVVCGKRSQTITWNQDLSGLIVAQKVALSASATSGLPISYQLSNPDLAVFENGALRVLAAGELTITAIQSGNNVYTAATPVQKTITLGAAVHLIVDSNMVISSDKFYTSVTIMPSNVLTVAETGKLSTAKLIIETKEDTIGELNWLGQIKAEKWMFRQTFIDESVYHYLSLPFDCRVADICVNIPAERWVYGTDWLIREYDGAIRAEKGPLKGAWTHLSPDSVLRKGVAYLIGVSEDVVLEFSAISETHKEIPVSVKSYPATLPVNAGWNFVPTGLWTSFNGNAVLSNGELLNYVYLSNDHMRTFTAYEVSEVTLAPFAGFFVQIPEDITEINFEQEVKLSAPKFLASQESGKVKITLQHTDLGSDATTLIIDDAETTDYRINHDLHKMTDSEGRRPQIYSLGADTKLAYNALPTLAAKDVMLGCTVSQNGIYTFCKTNTFGNIKSLKITDLYTGTVTDLQLQDYTVELDKGTYETRFVLSVNKNTEISTAIESTALSEIVFVRNTYGLLLSGIPDGTKYVLFDATGRILKMGTADSDNVTFYPEARGVYYVRYTMADGTTEVLKTIF